MLSIGEMARVSGLNVSALRFALIDWSAGRPFAWLDDEITDAARTLLRRVDHRHGLTDTDFAVLDEWLRAG